MTKNSFTPVSIRRRSAAQECADAHTVRLTCDSVASGDGRIGRVDVGFLLASDLPFGIPVFTGDFTVN